MKNVIVTIALISVFTLKLTAQEKKKVLQTAPAQVDLSIARGKLIYNQHCTSCHQADGSGVAGLNPPLSKTIYVLGDKSRLINIVLKGLNTVLEIDDEVYNNAMPPLNFLTDQQVADVLTFVRNNFQNKATSVTAVEVKTTRSQTNSK